MNILLNLWHHISFFLAPVFCSYCQTLLDKRMTFCQSCDQSINPIVSTKIMITPTKAMNVFAVSFYKEPLKSLILAKSRSYTIASKQLGNIIWDKSSIRYQQFDCIVPVPLHWRRFAKRGFNQAEIIASIIAQKSAKPLYKAIKRKRCTKFQSKIDVAHRFTNVKGAFILDENLASSLEGKHILLVDDLMTTGATLQTSAKVLLPCKPASISAVVACRTG